MSAETLLSVGIDLGTTTTQLVFSRLTVRNEGSAFSVPNYTVAAREVLRRSAVHFTPLRSERELDAEAIARIVDAEYAAAGIDRRAVQTGAGAVKNTNGGVSNMDAETQRQTPKLRTNLDTNFLKLFAILTMVVDHVGTVFFPQHPEFRWVGRLAFPIFCY